jgi:glyoxylase-like metal-dependent hydrolase (beta-lactamase superfamily II)
MRRLALTFPGAVLTAVFMVWASVPASVRQQPPYTLKLVGPNVWAAIDNEQSPDPATSNAGFIVGDSGVAVVDTLGTVAAARSLLADIRRETGRPIAYAVDTHHHIDHVAGNAVFKDAGTEVIAQRRVRCWIRSENARLFGPEIPPPLAAVLAGLQPPTRIYDNAVDWPLGAVNVQLRHLPGHTGADTVVVIPGADVVFAGDLLWHDMLPTLIDATTSRWVETLDVLRRDYRGYVFVPGHGDVATTADVSAFREYLVTLRAAVAEARTQGRSGDALVDGVLPVLKQQFGRWAFIDAIARDNILQVDAELRGVKRVPVTLPNRAACASPY